MKSMNYLFLFSVFMVQDMALSAMREAAPVESFEDIKARHAKEMEELNAQHDREKSRFEAIKKQRNFELQEIRNREARINDPSRVKTAPEEDEKVLKNSHSNLESQKRDFSRRVSGRPDLGLVTDVGSRKEYINTDLLETQFQNINNENYITNHSDEALKIKQDALKAKQDTELELAIDGKLSPVAKKAVSLLDSFKAFFGFGDDSINNAADSIVGIVGKDSIDKSLSGKNKISIKNALKNLDADQRVQVLDKIILKIEGGDAVERRTKFIEFINKILPEDEQVVMTRTGVHDTHVAKKIS